MIGAEKIEGISPLFAQVQRRPVNIEKAPAGSVLSVPFGVGVNSCYCVGCEIIKGAAVPDKLLYGAAGGPSLQHRDYRCTGFPFLIAGDVDCFRLAVSEPCPRYRKRTRRHAHRCCPAPQSRLPGGFIALAGHCKAVVGAWGPTVL